MWKNAFIPPHSKVGYANAAQCYFISTQPVLFGIAMTLVVGSVSSPLYV